MCRRRCDHFHECGWRGWYRRLRRSLGVRRLSEQKDEHLSRAEDLPTSLDRRRTYQGRESAGAQPGNSATVQTALVLPSALLVSSTLCAFPSPRRSPLAPPAFLADCANSWRCEITTPLPKARFGLAALCRVRPCGAAEGIARSPGATAIRFTLRMVLIDRWRSTPRRCPQSADFKK